MLSVATYQTTTSALTHSSEDLVGVELLGPSVRCRHHQLLPTKKYPGARKKGGALNHIGPQKLFQFDTKSPRVTIFGAPRAEIRNSRALHFNRLTAQTFPVPNMVATASSAAADISTHVGESVHSQFSASTEPVHNSVGVAVRLGSEGEPSTGNRSESPTSEEPEEHCGPMDLSSGGGVASQSLMATPTFMMAAAAAAVAKNQGATPTSLADSLLNARRLAEFVKAQQQMRGEARPATPPQGKTVDDVVPAMLPRKRAWPELQLDLSAMVSEKLKKCSDDNNEGVPGGRPASPAESHSSEGTATPSSNKEVKKRRLDELLSKKFSVTDSPPHSSESNRATPSINSDAGVHPASDHQHHLNNSPIRRDSTEIKRQNRRKRSSPTQSVNSMSSSPITLAVRPNSELLMESQKIKSAAELIKAAELKAEENNVVEDNNHDQHSSTKNGGAMKNQILQLHLAQAALLNQTSLFPGFPGFPGAAAGIAGAAAQAAAAPPNPNNSPGNNPLLYYGYYAQMIQGLQSQQQKLLEQLTGKAKNNILPSISKQTKPELKPTFSPSLLPILPNRSSPSPKYHHHQFQNHHREENSSPHQLLSSPLSAGGDEPRRRAPRALTGRYVKSGPGASPRTLAILRKKIQERLKLKELLGENSNLYFGALNKQKHVKAKVSTAASRF